MDERLSNLTLLPFESPTLRTKLPEFNFDEPPINPTELVLALQQFMIATGGVGLSANQVDLPYRAFVYGMGQHIHNVFNPKMLGASKETVIMREGCLSLPNVWLSLKRPVAVLVSYQTETGEAKVEELTGVAARVFQHEFDHMEGRNFTMLASPLKLKRALTTLRKKVRNGQKLRAADVA